MTTRIENATVWTGQRLPDGSIHVSDAVAFDGGSVLALGDAARALAADEVVDAQGGFVLPAFRDGHVHAIFAGLEREYAPVRGHSTPQETAQAVGDWARAHPQVEWIQGLGFDHTLAPNGVFHAAWLDAQVPDRPVYLQATDYHTVWVNSEAMRRAGYTADTPQPHDGEIVRDDIGAPIGTLREWGAWRPVRELMPPPPAALAADALRYSTSALASSGISWVQDAWNEPGNVDSWLAAHAAGALAVRADLALWADPNTWRDQLEAMQQARARVEAAGMSGDVRTLSATTVKFFADGVIESATAAVLEPYCDCPHSRGLPNWDPAELAAAVIAVDALGFTPHIHAIGDAAVRNALDALEAAARTNGRRDSRPTIAHVQLADAADIPRFAQLGVIANYEPLWARMDSWQTALTAPRLGQPRTDQQYRMRSMIDSGAVMSFGSDWPVSDYRPLAGIAVAVTRKITADSPTWVPQECISVDEALLAYTVGSGFQSKDPRGAALRAGGRADIAMLAADPRMVEPFTIADIAVNGTWRDGVRTHG